MRESIEGQLLGKPAIIHIGDNVGILQTFDDHIDTFAGTEGEVIEITDNGFIGVRTHNGIVLWLTRLEVAPPLPKKRGGRQPVKRGPDEQMIRMSISLPESDVAYLRTFNPRNLSDAIRQVIQIARDAEDERELADNRF